MFAERISVLGIWMAIVATVMAILVLAAVPPVDRDALTHHLAVPKLYLMHGGITEIPEVPFSYYPMNLELLYLAALYLGSDIVPKYIHFGFALLTAGLVGAFLRRRVSKAAAVLGVLLFLSLPVIVKLSITVYVDLGLIFFSTAAWLQLFRWVESGLRFRHLAAAGFLAGLCLGTKPNGMLVFFFLSAAVPFLHRRTMRRSKGRAAAEPGVGEASATGELRAVGLTVVFVLIAVAAFSPWLARNYIWTGNPLYPWVQGWFGSKPHLAVPDGDRSPAEEPESGLGPSGSSKLGHFAVRKLVFGEELLAILAIPLRVFFEGRDDDPRLFDGRLNPYLLIFPIISIIQLLRGPRPPGFRLEVRTLGVFSAGYLLFSFFLVDMRVRYLGPILPPLAILAAIGIHDLMGFLQKRGRPWLRLFGPGALAAAVAGLLALNGAYIVGLFKVVEPFDYLGGRLSRDDYILKHRPEYAAVSWLNHHLPQDAKIISLFNGNRIYYSDREMVSAPELFAALVESGDSPEALCNGLLKHGFSHMLVRADLFHHWVGQRFDEPSRQRLQGFIGAHLRELMQANGFLVFRIERS
jgi:hypothetical protein